MKKITSLTLLALGMGLATSAYAQTVFSAGTDFVADLPEYQVNFTLTDNASSVTAVGDDNIGSSFSLYFDTAVDMSALASGGNQATLDFTANSGHAANSSFSISLFDSGFAASYDLTGFNFSDSTLIGSGSNSGVDLTDIQGLTVTTGGLGSAVNIDVASFTIVPEPSTAGLIAGLLALGSVMLRRRAA